MTAPQTLLATKLGGVIVDQDRIIAVDADTMEAVAFAHGLTIEIDGDYAVMTLDGITFVAELAAVTS